MSEPITFYFDFSSPYGYLAAQRIDEVAARQGRTVAWRPFLLGVVFKQTRAEPLLNLPLKGDYARHDIARTARRLGVPFVLPRSFPFMAVAPSRAFYWLHDQDPEAARGLAKALYHKAFGEGGDISLPEAVAEVAAGQGVDRDALLSALQDPGVKDRLKREVDAAVQAGAFGSPMFFVDGEPFWGVDRLPDVEAWLASGGW